MVVVSESVRSLKGVIAKAGLRALVQVMVLFLEHERARHLADRRLSEETRRW